jgi:hypothetical protein
VDCECIKRRGLLLESAPSFIVAAFPMLMWTHILDRNWGVAKVASLEAWISLLDTFQFLFSVDDLPKHGTGTTHFGTFVPRNPKCPVLIFLGSRDLDALRSSHWMINASQLYPSLLCSFRDKSAVYSLGAQNRPPKRHGWLPCNATVRSTTTTQREWSRCGDGHCPSPRAFASLKRLD